mgnify:FL=1
MSPLIGLAANFNATYVPHQTLDYVLRFKIEKIAGSYNSNHVLGYSIRVNNSYGVSQAYLSPNGGPYYSDINFYYAGTFSVEVKYFINDAVIETQTMNVVVTSANGEYGCCSVTMKMEHQTVGENGQFVLDQATGNVVFQSGLCGSVEEFDCIAFNNGLYLEHVISANAQTFSSNWSTDLTRYAKDMTGIYPNAVEQGVLNKWRIKESYTYKSELDGSIINTAATDDYKNYDRGTFGYSQFLWRDVSSNDYDKWIKTSNMMEYSANGDPIYEINALGVTSGALYGYNNTQVVGVVQHGRFFEVSFESFENTYTPVTSGPTYFDNGIEKSGNMTLVNTFSHTGDQCVEITSTGYFNIAPSLNGGLWSNTDVLDHDGFLVQVWVKTAGTPTFNVRITDSYSTVRNKNMYLAQSCGEWSLYEVELDGSDLAGIQPSRMKFTISCSDVSSKVYIDDVRIQPVKSEMVTYVYDNQQRLVANFDSQHFALIYQYNEEGKLIRKLKETSEGIVTLSETQYNSEGKPRQ